VPEAETEPLPLPELEQLTSTVAEDVEVLVMVVPLEPDECLGEVERGVVGDLRSGPGDTGLVTGRVTVGAATWLRPGSVAVLGTEATDEPSFGPAPCGRCPAGPCPAGGAP
jgi:hypothetical protein